MSSSGSGSTTLVLGRDPGPQKITPNPSEHIFCCCVQCHVLPTPIHADPRASVKAFKSSGDKYPVYVLRFRMKGLGAAAGGKHRANNFVLEPFLSAAAARSGPPKSSPLRERRRQEEESTRISPARELIPKVRIQGCGCGIRIIFGSWIRIRIIFVSWIRIRIL
jgi:hypothetical protein